MSLDWFGDIAKQRTHNAAKKALYKASAAMLTRANKTCPHDEGTLERSGKNTVDKIKLEAFVSYDTPYAVPVHEINANYRGKGRYKWLERTAQEMSPELENLIASAMRKELW